MGVADDFAHRRIEFLHDLDAVIGEVVGAQRERLTHDSVHLHRFALRRHLARKAKQVLHNLLGALRFFEDDAQVGLGELGNVRMIDEQVGEAEDRRQRIVDLVRHAGDQLSDGGHLLGVHQLGLQHGRVGDIGHHDNDRGDL